jgi:hypothetical protein
MIEKFLKMVYEGEKYPNAVEESRWASLRALDHETFLLIAASYNPTDVIKLNEAEFESLLTIAPRYLSELPAKWLFRKEFQCAVAVHAELGGMAKFKRGMQVYLSNADLAHSHQGTMY